MWFLKNLKTVLSYDPATLHLGVFPKETKHYLKEIAVGPLSLQHYLQQPKYRNNLSVHPPTNRKRKCDPYIKTSSPHNGILLLLLLSRVSRVQLCATPQRAAHQAPPSLGFSPGKNTGVGCQLRLQCMKVKSESEVAQSCPTLSDPVDCSPPGSSVLGISQARVLEWGATAFSKWNTSHL